MRRPHIIGVSDGRYELFYGHPITGAPFRDRLAAASHAATIQHAIKESGQKFPGGLTFRVVEVFYGDATAIIEVWKKQ